ncbi:MAG: hypothetical protein PHR81_10260 [Bacteroidales bacterium]|jgi:hypothetical protein|nr:hypothetical protein [Bacteroidales bacterium]MDD4215183.1 hypothetical protein [Bacteroidales bacterium]
MKNIIIVAVLFLIAKYCYSQDIVVLNNGNEIKSKNIEVNEAGLKINLFDINGKQIQIIKSQDLKEKRNLPSEQQTFLIPKQFVFMINYENGSNDFYRDKITHGVVNNVSNFIDKDNNPDAYKMYRDNYKRYSLARGLVGAGGGIFTFGTIALIVSYTNGKKDETDIGASYIFMGMGACFLGAGLPLYFTSLKKMNSAFNNYRNSLKTSQNNLKINFGITHDGLGMNVKF